jgi:peptide deformylase
MSIRKVALMGHPVLRTKAQPVPPAEIQSAGIQRLIDDMIATMDEYSGIGLAAPQVHESLRIFVAGIRVGDPPGESDEQSEPPIVVVINPEVVAVGRAVVEGWEGCLSIPDIRGRVPRAESVRVRALDRTGTRREFTAHGLPARVIQHETDHLDGILFFDRMKSFESLAFMEEYRRYWAREEDD